MDAIVKVKKTMSSVEIADIAGKRHEYVLRAIRSMEPAWEKVTEHKFVFSEYIDPTGRKLPMYELSQRECLYVATKFNDEARAKLIIRWEQLETNQLERKKQNQISDASVLIESFARCMNYNDNSKLLLYHNMAKVYELPSSLLPEYSKSVDTLLPLSKILEGTGISAVKGNISLESRGVIVKKHRIGSKGVQKSYWSIAPEYAYLGENQVSPSNPRETQPMWYAARQDEIVNLATNDSNCLILKIV
jgi:phage regulator Rha-like protein